MRGSNGKYFRRGYLFLEVETDPLNLLANTIVGRLFLSRFGAGLFFWCVNMDIKRCLTIAGSDCSGGAGVQADLKTFGALGCYGMSVITSVVAENPFKVISCANVPAKSVSEQIDAVFADIRVDAVKTGMIPDEETITAVSGGLRKYSPKIIICDPVMIATSGGELMQSGAAALFLKEIAPLCTLLTPNIYEAGQILGKDVSGGNMADAAKEISERYGIGAVLVKGGDLNGENSADVLYDGHETRVFSHKRINRRTTHGTGCTLSSAIAAYMAKGKALADAVALAKEYVSGAIEHGFEDIGALNHFYKGAENA